MTLGEQIQALRKDKGLSQEELGEKLGVARQSVSKWESGVTVPELDKLIAMSKLFGVSVGSLLGLEETGEPEKELTEREIKALESIVQRLVPPAPEPKRRRWWPKAVAALVVIGAGLFLMGRINSLENQLNSLHYNISNIDNSVSRQMNSLTGQMQDILEKQNSVTAGKDYEIVEMDLVKNEVTFALTATPREYREGMTAVFSAVGTDFDPVEVPGTLEAGQAFAVKLSCPLSDAVTLSVGFTADGVTVNQELGQESYLLAGTRLDFYGNLGWSVSDLGGRLAVKSLRASLNGHSPGQYKTTEGWQDLSVSKGSLRLWKNGELLWSEEREEIAQGVKIDDLPIPVEGITLEAGDRMVLSLQYKDNAGREDEAFLDGFWMNEDGKPEWRTPNGEEWMYPWK